MTDANKTVKSYDGENDVNIKSFQDSLRQYPSSIMPFLGDDGRAGLSGAVYAYNECECKIKGNGTLQFPLSIEFCDKHK